MSIEVSSESAVCFKCGRAYGRRKGNFPVSYQIQHKGVGYIPVCKECIDRMYNEYLAQCKNARDAVRQMCRKLDLYWDEKVYDLVERKSTTRSMMTQYISKLNANSYAGKSYDDTLSKEGTLWTFSKTNIDMPQGAGTADADDADGSAGDNTDVAKKEPTGYTSALDEPTDEAVLEYIKELGDFHLTKDIVAFWGAGYSRQMYAELEQRRAYWMSRLSDDGSNIDIGTETLLRQICSLEVEINRGRVAGKQMDAKVTLLNTLLGSANLKPVQKKADVIDDLASAPLGVKIYEIEKHKPLPDGDEREIKRAIKKYIWTWFGHICKLCNIKNGYTKLYDAEIERLRVKHPDYEDESDEDLIINDLTEDELETVNGDSRDNG